MVFVFRFWTSLSMRISSCIHVAADGIIFFFFLFPFLGLHLQHMEVPRPGVELELQLLAYTTAIVTRSEPCLQPTPHLTATPDP